MRHIIIVVVLSSTGMAGTARADVVLDFDTLPNAQGWTYRVGSNGLAAVHLFNANAHARLKRYEFIQSVPVAASVWMGLVLLAILGVVGRARMIVRRSSAGI